MLEFIRPVVLLAVMGFGPVAVVAPLLRVDPVDADEVAAKRDEAQRNAALAARPTPRAMTASRRQELDAGTTDIIARELTLAATAAKDGRHADAARTLTNVLRTMPHHHTARCRLLDALQAIGRWDGVETTARRLLNDDAHAWEAHRALLAKRRHDLGADRFAAELKDAKSQARQHLHAALAGHPKGADITDPAAGLSALGL